MKLYNSELPTTNIETYTIFKYLKNGIFLTCDNSSNGSTSMGHFTALDLSEKSSGRK